MNKDGLIKRMKEHTGLTKKDCSVALEGLLSAVTEVLQEGESIKLAGFGSFEVRHRAARTGRNPQTKEIVEIPAQTVPVFKAGKGLKESVASLCKK